MMKKKLAIGIAVAASMITSTAWAGHVPAALIDKEAVANTAAGVYTIPHPEENRVLSGYLTEELRADLEKMAPSTLMMFERAGDISAKEEANDVIVFVPVRIMPGGRPGTIKAWVGTDKFGNLGLKQTELMVR